MDITCRRCGEPTEADYLRHEMTWVLCRICGQPVDQDDSGGWYHCSTSGQPIADTHSIEPTERQFESAANGEVPEEVRAKGRDGWYRFVLAGKGCALCYGHTGDTATCPECAKVTAASTPQQRLSSVDVARCPVVSGGVVLSFAQLDDMDAASEGEFSDYL